MFKCFTLKYFFSLIFVLSTSFCFSQIIEGVVYTEMNEGLPQCNILIRDSQNPNQLLKHSLSNQNGSYSIAIDSEVNEFILEFAKLGYDSESFHFKTSEMNEKTKLDVTMFESIVSLDSVFIQRAARIQVKEDTVSYRATAFLDGSEQKVEDLLRKLPGIQVEADGLIKYRGKFIEKVLLDGDDLFDMNYTVGTKNMNVDIIDQVQAIENYSENSLLSGIEHTDKVALNLKLKKNIVDFSGNASFAYGIENRNQTDINALVISKRNKNFSNITYNNLGENFSPFDFFSNNSFNVNRSSESIMAPKLIRDNTFSNRLENSRSTINDNWFNSINHIFKVSNRLSVRFIFAYYQDQLNINQSNTSYYVFEDGTDLSTSQNETNVKKPEVFNGSLKLNWETSNNSSLEFSSIWNKENISTRSNLLTNDQNDLNTSLHTKSYFTQQQLLFTQKLNDQNAIQIKSSFTYNDSPQNFNLHPGLDILTGQIALGVENQQLSNFLKKNWNFETILFGLNENDKFQLSAFLNFNQNRLKSQLYQNEQIINELYLNDLEYDRLQTKFEGEYNFEFDRLNVKTALAIKNYWWKRVENLNEINTNNEKLVFSPSLNLNYQLNPLMKVFANYSYDQTPVNDNRLYTSYVLTSNRSMSRNEFSEKFHKKHHIIVGYNIYDMYKLFALNFNINYIVHKNNFFANTLVTEDLTKIEYLFLPESNSSFSSILSLEKFIPAFDTTFRLSGIYTNNQYKNIVNNSDIRDNQLEYYQIGLLGKSAFKSWINFENEFKLSYTTAKAKGIDQKFNNTYINNTFKLILKPHHYITSTLNYDYFSPNQKHSIDYHFVDATVRYSNPNKNFTYSLIAKNITNNKYFDEIMISDYYESFSSQSLNRAYLLLGIGFSF